MVWTHKNRWRRVTHTWLKGKEQMFRVHFSNGNVLTCTKKHRLLMSDGTWRQVGEYLEGMDVEPSQHSSGSADVQVTRYPDDQGHREKTEYDGAQRSARYQEEHARSGEECPVISQVLCREDWTEESDVGKDGGTAPSLEGTDFGSERLSDGETKWKARLRAPSRHDGGFGHIETAKGYGSSSHRWGWNEQQSGQSGSCYGEGAQDDPFNAEAGQPFVTIEKIEVGGSHEVYDITVEEDESYLSCGVFSHNSSSPNLQQIPAHSEDGKRIRGIFIPDEGQEWWAYDYSQIEYRLMVHDAVMYRLKGAQDVADQYARDPNTDFHQVVADMAGIPRKSAKTVNFGIAYGEGVPKLIKALNLTQEEGEEFMRKYHRNAPFMKPLANGYMQMAASEGEVRTLMNRKRRFDTWEITKRENGERKQVFLPHRVPGAKRAFTYAALNARIQGSAADIMKKAMVDIWESGVCDVLGVPQLTVHDELDGSKPKTKKAQKAFEEIGSIMQNVVKLHVPLLVEGGTGPNWGAAK
jgi:hypothetical protein